MSSDEESKLQFNRQKVRIKNLNQLLEKRKIVTVPQTTLRKKLSQKLSFQSSSIKKTPLKLHIRSKSSAQFQAIKKDSPLKNNKIYQRLNYQTAGNFRSVWNPNSSIQYLKRNTVAHFRSQSLELQPNPRNSMWRPIHIIKRSHQSNKKNEKDSQSIQIEQKNIFKLRKSQFLKKGSDINKRVVVNLLKVKLGQKLKNEQDEENTIRNYDILKMIKIYKGYDQAPSIVDPNKTIQMKKTKKQKLNYQIKDLNLKSFPFQNTNIQLSVSQWNQKMSIQHQRFKLPSDISQQFCL